MIEKIKKSRLGRSFLLCVTQVLSFFNQVIPKNKKQILFYDSAREYLDDNTEALYSWLKRNGYDQKYKFVVCVPRETKKLSFSEYRPVGAFRGTIAFLTSKYVFFSFGDFRIKPSKKQIVINQWHGTPAKRIGKLTYDENYQREKLDNFTYLLSNSDTFVPVFSEAFGCDESRVKVIGGARTDYFYSQREVLPDVGINRSCYKKLLLWMPTFRSSNDNRFNDGDTTRSETLLPVLSMYEDVRALDRVLAENNVLLVIKIHPMAIFKKDNYKNIVILTNDDIIPKGVRLYEFVKEFDALITDYSSIYCDYLMLNRPIGFTLDDYSQYEGSRGFVFDNFIDYMPGHHMYDVEDMIDFIVDISNDIDRYKSDREKMIPVFCKYVDGNNCMRLAKCVGLTD